MRDIKNNNKTILNELLGRKTLQQESLTGRIRKSIKETITFEVGLLNKEQMEVGKIKICQAEGTVIAKVII